MSRLTLTLAVLLAVALPAVEIRSLHAGISYTGAVSFPPAFWTSSNDNYVGIRAPGTVTVDSGSAVNSTNVYLGYYTGGAGTVTIAGANSKWTNAGNIYVGYNYGAGTLNITDGGAVTVGAITQVGSQFNGTGTINFDGGILTTQSLYASPTQLLGSGTINTRGLLTDTDIVFDSTRGLSQTVPGFGSISVNLDMSNPNDVGELGVGWMGSGSLTIQDGRVVTSTYGRIGYGKSSTGAALVDGPGSAWTSVNDLNVAESGVGTLSVTRGGAVTSASGCVGRGSHSVGIATVAGDGSKWTSNFLTIGNQGNGTLTIAAGGSVSSGTAYLGVNSGSTGLVTVDGAGSTWTNSAVLYLGDNTNGSLRITNGGTVSDRTCYMGYLGTATASATVDGPASTWIHSDGVNVGYGANCKGTLDITNGGAVRTFNGSIGYNAGAAGTVTISGVGSSWINSTANVFVGCSGNGTLNIVAGGTFINHESGMGSSIGQFSGSIGVATVDGVGSTWTEDDVIVVGGDGNGTLNVSNGGRVTSSRLWLGYSNVGRLKIASGGSVCDNTVYIGLQTGAKGMALVDGPGSSWNNTGELIMGYVGPNRNGSATVGIRNGSTVTASSVSINSLSLASIDVGSGSSFSVGGGGITNNGTIRIVAGAGVPARSSYSPISCGQWTGSGVCQAVGGMLDADSHLFTTSDVQSGVPGSPITIDLAQMQRILVSDVPNDRALGCSFLMKTGSAPLAFTATKISDGPLSLLAGSLDPGHTVLTDWTLSATGGYASGDPAYLSFSVGSGQSWSDLLVWQYASGNWSKYDATDLTCDGTYASFTVTDMGTYAVTGIAVPEPSTLVVLNIGAISLLAYAWLNRKHKA